MFFSIKDVMNGKRLLCANQKYSAFLLLTDCVADKKEGKSLKKRNIVLQNITIPFKTISHGQRQCNNCEKKQKKMPKKARKAIEAKKRFEFGLMSQHCQFFEWH